MMYKEDYEDLIKKIETEIEQFENQIEVNKIVIAGIRNKAGTAKPKPVIKPVDKKEK